MAEAYYARLRKAMADLQEAEWNRVTPYLGWRARDVLAHLASATQVIFRPLLQSALAGDLRGPDSIDIFGINEVEVQRRRNWPVDRVLCEFDRELAAHLLRFREIGDDQWLAPAWFITGPVSVRSLLLIQLGDYLFHERDILKPAGRWRGLDPEITPPLVDWFMREFRQANFRKDRAGRLRVVAVFRLRGVGGGAWTMHIADGTCAVTHGEESPANVVFEADTEQIVAATQSRSPPWMGNLARRLSWILPGESRVHWIAGLTGWVSLILAGLTRRIRIHGSLHAAARMGLVFWNHWDRLPQTRATISRGR